MPKSARRKEYIMIRVKDLKKSFGEREILKGINLEIKEGEIFGLLGPSGAGKTTLIKILTGQLVFEEGDVKTLGKDVRNLSGEDHKGIGIMMDQFGVYERLSCLDNLKIFAEIYKIPLKVVMDTLEDVGLSKAMKTPAANLSKGMRNRLQLARVFMQTPKIIFLDEPTSGLDPASAKAIHKLIMEKKKEGCTLFLTTHDMSEATKLCDHVALLNEGVIVEYGSPKEICRRYDHQKKICLHLKNGREEELPNGREAAQKIAELLENDAVETIHSTEPNLETVFLELTGRNLEENSL